MTTTAEISRADVGTKRPRQHKNAKGSSNHHHTPKNKGGRGRPPPTTSSLHQKTKGQKKHPKPKSRSGAGRGTAAPATIVFDVAARAKYLQGFSQRKQERRAYGLAMQKVKDRRAKLERRAELKSAQQEQILEAEEQKRKLLQEQIIGMRRTTKGLEDDQHGSAKQNSNSSLANPEEDGRDEIQTYQDEQTQQQWGGTVIVTTSTHIPGSEEDDLKDGIDDQHTKKQRAPAGGHKTQDAEQAYAGNVERFLKQLKGHLPSKRKSRDVKQRRGGQHGASQMKGVGSGSDLKMAQKVLTRATKQAKGKDRGAGKKRTR